MGKVTSIIDARNDKARKKRIEEIQELLDIFESTGEIRATGDANFDRRMSRTFSFLGERDESEIEMGWKRDQYVIHLVSELEYLEWPKHTYEESKRRMAVLEQRWKIQRELLRLHTECISKAEQNEQTNRK